MSQAKRSKTMEKAIRLAQRGGLVRCTGGYWISAEDYAGPRCQDGVEWVGTATVRALESRGLLTIAPGQAPEWRRRRVLAEVSDASE